MKKHKKIAIVYDRLVKWGGAERLIKSLLKIFPSAHLFTLQYKPSPLLNFLHHHPIHTSFFNSFPLKLLPHELLFPWASLAFEQFNFSNFDLVISLGSAESKSIITKPPLRHFHYLFTPNRYLWHEYHTFLQSLPLLFKTFFISFAHQARITDFITSFRPDQFITLSYYTQRLTLKYYHRPSTVIYPPFNPNYWLNLKPQPLHLPFKHFFLSVNRLVPQKKLNFLIQIFNQLGLPLVIVGKGWLAPFLKKQARKNILFLHDLSDSQLKYLYQNSIAFIMPQIEDFGYTALEAACFYKPIIHYHQGGQAEILKNYPLSYSFNSHQPRHLSRLLQSLFKKSPTTLPHLPSLSKMKRYFAPFQFTNFKHRFLNLISSNI